jgi:hypothetical protein
MLQDRSVCVFSGKLFLSLHQIGMKIIILKPTLDAISIFPGNCSDLRTIMTREEGSGIETAFYNMQNMMNQAFPRCSEARLIEVMKIKMQTIQLASILNLIQM